MTEALVRARDIRRAPRVVVSLVVLALGAYLLPSLVGSPGLSARGPSASMRPGPTSVPSGSPSNIATHLLSLTTDARLHVVGNALENASGERVQLIGVDATGTEDACIEDKGFSWGPFNSTEAKSIASWGANAVRVPLNEDCWLGINGAPAQYSGAAYQRAIVSWVAALNAAGLVAILDLHWSAPGTIPATKQWEMPDASHSVTFWSQVASLFQGDPLVIFDLFSEPFLGSNAPNASDWSCWLSGCTTTVNDCATTQPAPCTVVTYQVAGMQELVNAVRNVGADQPLMVSGLVWASTLSEWLTHEPVDPLHQLVASFHTYYDHWGCNSLNCWNATMAPLAGQVPVVTGEVGEKTCSGTFVQQYMQWADLHGVSYLLWTWQPANTIGTLGCGAQRLLSNWSGTPDAKNPVASLLLNNLGLGLARKL